jgi:redox-sensitive bicupin YhaK (pirin superfamily)
MYHGSTVPGFPEHPHRGFETITFARKGYIDHSDSLGAAARFGRGDVQWMTAGSGVVHCEMFPLLSPDGPNTVELFQIWMNLPAERQDGRSLLHHALERADPAPRHVDDAGREAEVTVIAGELRRAHSARAAARLVGVAPEADVSILHIVLEPGATWSHSSRPRAPRRCACSTCSKVP